MEMYYWNTTTTTTHPRLPAGTSCERLLISTLTFHTTHYDCEFLVHERKHNPIVHQDVKDNKAIGVYTLLFDIWIHFNIFFQKACYFFVKDFRVFIVIPTHERTWGERKFCTQVLVKGSQEWEHTREIILFKQLQLVQRQRVFCLTNNRF